MVRKKIKIYIGCFLIGLTSCSQMENRRPKLQIDEPEYNLGKLKIGDSLTHSFMIKNTGVLDLKVLDAKSSCGCTVVDLKDSLVLKPNDTSSIKVKFIGKEWQKDSTITNTIVLRTNTDSIFHVLKLVSTVN